MNKILKITAIFVVSVLLACFMCACDRSDNTSSTTDSFVSESSAALDDIKTKIIGQWGRQGKTMHYFNSDMTCIVGGMQGTYEIDDGRNLILTTMSGSATVYEWAKSGSEASSSNYWNMTDDTLTVNGNTFTKISDEEFENPFETADDASQVFSGITE